MYFAMAVHELLLKNTKGVFPTEGFRLHVYLLVFTRHCVTLVVFYDQTVQHLEPGDHAQRMDLCHWVQAHPELLDVILFIDEASFTLDGVNNSRNAHTWSHINLHETSVTNFQRRFSVNV
jgi:hypothetical protein